MSMRGLRRELGLLETASVSVGVMAPTLAMSVTGAAAARELGPAAPLAFVVAALGVGLVAYGFVRLAGEFAHAGSVYAFVGRTLGPRAGFVAGWALLGTYLVFPPVSIAGVAIFGRSLLARAGLAADADWYPLAVGAWVVIALLALRGIRPTTRSVLLLEVVSVVLILVLVVVILARVPGRAAGTAPLGTAGRDASLGATFTLPHGIGLSALALAATSGFLAFAGFESAGSLGEEAVRPRRYIPAAIVGAVAFGGVFYVVCTLAQSLGFGTDPAGVARFQASQAPLSDLAQQYVGRFLAVLLDAGACLSALGAGLGGVTVGSRMLFALARDGAGPRGLATVRGGTGVPVGALAVELAAGLALLTGFRLAGTTALDTFFYLATPGVLSLLVMYVLTNFGAARLLARRRPAETTLPVLGALVAGYVLARNVWPVAAWPAGVLPVLVLVWVLAGIALTVAVPGLVRRVAGGLDAGIPIGGAGQVGRVI